MKEALSLESVLKALTGIIAYFGILATPEKAIISGLFLIILGNFIFSVWSYYHTKKSVKREQELRELFLSRFLTTEARADLLLQTHRERHPEDDGRFFDLERKLLDARFKELNIQACGSCGEKKKHD